MSGDFPSHGGDAEPTHAWEAVLAPYLCDEVTGSALSETERVQRERALLEGAGLFDADWYRRNHPQVEASGESLLEHFCRQGWRELCDPSPTFDVWWYWASHLDPSRERINPLVHYALVGRDAGLDTRPGPYHPASAGQALPKDRPIRRACLFAGYDPDGLVDDSVVDYLRELSRHADVWYLADCDMRPGQLEKLAGITRAAWAARHGAYDFGSYARLARDLVGWETLEAYDEVLLANDSCYLLRSLEHVFDRMDHRRCDWWGMQATKGLHATQHKPENRFQTPVPIEEVQQRWLAREDAGYPFDFHVGSYFLVLRQPVVRDQGFRRRLNGVVPQTSKLNTIRKYEIGLGRYLMASGHPFATFIEKLHPFHPLYTARAFDLLGEGFPFLKRYLLAENHYHTPHLDRWKERVLEHVPSAPIERIERHLLRTANAEKLHRNLRLMHGPAGHVMMPRLLAGAAFEHADAATPTFDHWWAFPVCAFTHRFTGNERAVFEEVKNDPSIKKIVLTRRRHVEVEGENVVVVPLRSPEGQYHLLRAGQIFIKHSPTRNIIFPVSPRRHNIINLWHGIPLKRIGYASLDMHDKLDALAEEHRKCRAVICSSRVDALAMTAAFYPLSYHQVWNTGLPRHDFILRRAEDLPVHLRDQAALLRSLVGGRRLVVFLPTFRNAQAEAYYHFSESELAWLRDWLRQHDAVLGVREHMADKARTYSTMLAGLGALDLGDERFPDVEVLYRQADLLITDYSSSFFDFMLTGKPMVSFAYDHAHYANDERGLFYELGQVFPGPVCGDFGELSRALETAFDMPGDLARMRDEQIRQLFFDHRDDANAWRVVQKVKDLYQGTSNDDPQIHAGLAHSTGKI